MVDLISFNLTVVWIMFLLLMYCLSIWLLDFDKYATQYYVQYFMYLYILLNLFNICLGFFSPDHSGPCLS